MARHDGTENLIPLNERTPEERREIAKKGVETRRKKKEEKLALQRCMKTLLNLPPKSKERMKILENFGFEKGDMTNKTLLMVALFQKGLTGDVAAIREITNMMDKLEMFEDSGKVAGSNITINLVSTGEAYQPNEKDEQDIWEVENHTKWMDDDDEWESE